MNSSRIRVLVVSAEKVDFSTAQRALYKASMRYLVSQAADLEAALASIELGCDAVIVDDRLDFAADLAERVRVLEPALPVIEVPAEELGCALLDKTIHYAVARANAERELQRLSRYDQLTGLPNRAYFAERLRDAIARAQRSGAPVALLHMNLDGFKTVNDTLGASSGDTLLRAVSRRLVGSVRAVDAVARLGGDEFVVVLEGMAAPDDAAIVVQRIVDALVHPCMLDSRQYVISSSIGVALYPGDSEAPDGLIRCADAAMQRAKEAGGGYQFYTRAMTESAEERAALVRELQAALENEEFVLHYQPQADVRTGQIVGVEALLRWQRGDRLVPPMRFIPTLESSGLIVPVGEWVMRRACADVARWRAEGVPACRVAVNVSPQQFRSGRLPSLIRAVLADSGLPGEALEIELTEGLVMADTDESIVALAQLKECGVRISIDDFGTGYSSLAYLKRFDVDVIKVDRSFIKDIPDEDDGVIASSIIALAHALGKETIAEGVETPEQLGFLAGTGCEGYQGYFFSRPIPAEDVHALMRGRLEAASAPH